MVDFFKSGLIYFHEADDKTIGTLNKIPIMDSMMENLKCVGKHKIDYAPKYRSILDSLVSINNNGCVAIVIKFFNNQNETRNNFYEFLIHRNYIS